MTRDGLTRMDVDTRWAYHRKARKLQRLYPKNWPTYYAAYLALLGEVWLTKHPDLTLEDAWVPAMPCRIADALQALHTAGYLEAQGTIPPDSWSEWVLPAIERLEAKSKHGKDAADKRWHSSGNAGALPEQSLSNTPRQPTTPSTPLTPSSAREFWEEGDTDETEALQYLARKQCHIGAPGNGLHRKLIELVNRHGMNAVIGTFDRLGHEQTLDARGYIFGASNVLDPIPSGKAEGRADREAEERESLRRRTEATRRYLEAQQRTGEVA